MIETAIQVLLYLNIGLTILALGVIVYFRYKIKKLKVEETMAIILNIDQTVDDVVKVNPTDRKFKHGKKSYNLVEPYIKVFNKRFLIYKKNKADPIDPVDSERSRLSADVYNAIIEEEVTKKLNNYREGFGLGNLTPKQIVIILGVIGAIIYMIRSGAI